MRVYDGGDRKKDIVAIVARVRHGRYVAPDRLPAALEAGSPWLPAQPTDSYIVRMHDQCHTSELFGSVKCDCQHQLDYTLGFLSDLAVSGWRRRSAMRAGRGDVTSPTTPPPAAAAAAVADPCGGSATLPPLHTAPHAGCDAAAWADVDPDTILGVLLYLPQEGRGIGLGAKVAAYALQEDSHGVVPGFLVLGDDGEVVPPDGDVVVDGLDTVDANRALGLPDDARDYAGAADVLTQLQLLAPAPTATATDAPTAAAAAAAFPTARLLTNNPRKVERLRALGVPVSGTVPCIVCLASPLAAAYVRAKAERMGHTIPPAAQAAMPASPLRVASGSLAATTA